MYLASARGREARYITCASFVLVCTILMRCPVYTRQINKTTTTTVIPPAVFAAVASDHDHSKEPPPSVCAIYQFRVLSSFRGSLSRSPISSKSVRKLPAILLDNKPPCHHVPLPHQVQLHISRAFRRPCLRQGHHQHRDECGEACWQERHHTPKMPTADAGSTDIAQHSTRKSIVCRRRWRWRACCALDRLLSPRARSSVFCSLEPHQGR